MLRVCIRKRSDHWGTVVRVYQRERERVNLVW